MSEQLAAREWGCVAINGKNKLSVPCITKDNADRFWECVEKCTSSQCWNWCGPIRSGYGRFSFNSKTYQAHRVAYWLSVKHADNPDVVRHLCHNRLCCNPRHLAPGDVQDNANDQVFDGRSLKGELAPNVKLTEYDVRRIVRLSDSGMSYKLIAECFDVSQTCVARICVGKSWTHVTGRKYQRKRLTEIEAKEIKKELQSGRTIRSIANQFGRSIGCVGDISSGRSHSHV